MPQFTFIARTEEGKRKEGSIEASNINKASEKLTNQKLVVIKLVERDSSFDFMGPFLDRLSLKLEKLKTRVVEWANEEIQNKVIENNGERIKCNEENIEKIKDSIGNLEDKLIAITGDLAELLKQDPNLSNKENLILQRTISKMELDKNFWNLVS